MNKKAEFVLQSLRCSKRSCLCSRAWLGKGNVHCPAHDDKNPSCSVSQDNGTLLVHCHAGCEQDSVISALVKRGLWPTASIYASNQALPHRREWAAYDALSGEHISNHVRIDKEGEEKRVFWAPSGVKTSDLSLYRVDVLREKPGCPVIVCEGEPATDALATQEKELGTAAVGTMTGAAAMPGEAALVPLVQRDVYLWPDNDSKGIRHMGSIGAVLTALGCKSIHVIDWPASPPKGDAADAISQGVDITSLIATAAEFNVGLYADQDQAIPVPGVHAIRLSDVEPEEVSWLWRGYIPYGKLTVLGGDPGLGKSWATLDLGARVTVGAETPDGNERIDVGAVVLLTAEDGLADTVRPRIDAQGGNAELVSVVEGVVDAEGHEHHPSLLKDIEQLEAVVVSTRARLVIVDPLNAYTGNTNGYVDTQIRQVLTPLSKMAERTGAAVLLVMHLNQDMSLPVLYRFQGTIGYLGAVRSALVVARDTEDPEKRVMALIKSNLTRSMPAFAFTIAGDPPTLSWLGQVDTDITELLAAGPAGNTSKLEQAKSFLKSCLSLGAVPTHDVLSLATTANISVKTLRRAADVVGVKKSHAGEPGQQGGGHWLWQLPETPDAHDDLPLQIGHLANDDHLDSCGEASKMATNHKAPVTEDGKVANSGAQGVLDGFAGLMTDGQDGHRILEH